MVSRETSQSNLDFFLKEDLKKWKNTVSGLTQTLKTEYQSIEYLRTYLTLFNIRTELKTFDSIDKVEELIEGITFENIREKYDEDSSEYETLEDLMSQIDLALIKSYKFISRVLAHKSDASILKAFIESAPDSIVFEYEHLLSLAIKNYSYEVITLLLELGADPTGDSNLALKVLALRCKNKAQNALLFEKFPSIAHHLNSFSEAILYAQSDSNYSLMGYLIENGADINYQNGLPLLRACCDGFSCMIGFLVGKGADFSIGNYYILDCNITHDVCSILLDKGLDPNVHQGKIMESVIRASSNSLVKRCVELGIDLSGLGEEFLHQAVKNLNYESIEMMEGAGAGFIRLKEYFERRNGNSNLKGKGELLRRIGLDDSIVSMALNS